MNTNADSMPNQHGRLRTNGGWGEDVEIGYHPTVGYHPTGEYSPHGMFSP